MGRDLRYIPPNSLQHIVDVVSQNRHLLAPSRRVNERFLGVLGRAQTRYGMVICAVVVMSSHYHLLLRPRDGKHLSEFMCFFKTNLAKEIGGRLRQWKGGFFHDRYHSTTVSDEDTAQVRVLRYILSHGPKEHLVDRVRQWPGVHCAASLIDGQAMAGRWMDRTAEYEARGRRERDGVEPAAPGAFAHEVAVELSPLPCWEHLAEDVWRGTVDTLVAEIDREAAAERRLEGIQSVGVAAVLSQDPFKRPGTVRSTPKPRFHTASKEALGVLIAVWHEVTRAFDAASKSLRQGNVHAKFPPGTFPPSLPFVPFAEPACPARGQPI